MEIEKSHQGTIFAMWTTWKSLDYASSRAVGCLQMSLKILCFKSNLASKTDLQAKSGQSKDLLKYHLFLKIEIL